MKTNSVHKVKEGLSEQVEVKLNSRRKHPCEDLGQECSGTGVKAQRWGHTWHVWGTGRRPVRLEPSEHRGGEGREVTGHAAHRASGSQGECWRLPCGRWEV